jgi:pyruvate dehydrogenase E1 component beta subunit
LHNLEAEGVSVPQADAMTLSYRDAIRNALGDAMRADERVVLLGEDIGRAGGPFKATHGLYEEFGGERVIDTPIAETGFTGAALGMAITGLRPVVEIMFADFLLVAMDQVANSIAKYRYLSGGQTAVPLVVRAVGGAGLKFGAQHSATAESWLLPFPGLKIVCPSSPGEAYAMLRWAIRDDNPVVVVEHKALYGVSGPVSRGDPPGSIGGPQVIRIGRDLTLVASLAMVSKAVAAADVLSREGIEVEVIDVRVLRPLDVQPIVDSVKKTHQLLLVAEEPVLGSWMNTVATAVLEQAFDYLERPVKLVGLPDVPMPVGAEDLAIPSAELLVERVHEALRS